MPVARFAIRETLGIVVMGVALFWSSGTLDWWPAWALLSVLVWWVAATAWVIVRFHPSLLPERLGPVKGAKGWDTAIMSAVGMLSLVQFVVAGFDLRFGWTPAVPAAAQPVGLSLSIFGYGLGIWALAYNPFFSQIVRIQVERNHTVATGGPYRYVRHPAYVGTILFQVAVPMLLASWWALIPGGLTVLLLLVRTALEDRTLHAELQGYSDYAQDVRHRLIPGIW
ncbi:MAG: isoprenylcysteine carboxylmethyltransferase family protein [Trueperaceae bacterium]|nr:MAG: isoprenylcysteine carboxylmethyltransferase family protein [Trueperaceae bacterium]